MDGDDRGRGDAPRDRAGRRAASARPAPTPRRLRASSTPTGEVVGEGSTAPAGGPHAEIVALAAGRRAGPRRHRRCHARTLQPHRPHRPVQPGAHRRRGRPRRGRRARPRPGRRRRRRDACGRRASQVESGVRESRGRAGQRLPGSPRSRRGRPVRDLEVRRHPGRPLRGGRRHQPVDHLGRRPGPTCTRCAATVDAIIAGVGTVLADDPQLTVRDLRDGRCATGSRCGSWSTAPAAPRPKARVRDGAARHLDRHRRRGRRRPGRPGRPARSCSRSCTAAACAARCWRAARRWPARSWRPGWSTRSSATSRRSCSAPARPRSARPASAPSPRPSTSIVTDVTQVGPDLRLTATPDERGMSVFTGIVEELGDVVASIDAGGDAARLARARPARHRRRRGTATRSRSTASA